MRLLVVGDELLLSAEKRIIRIEGPELTDELLSRALLVENRPNVAPIRRVESVKRSTVEGGVLIIETNFHDEFGELNVPPPSRKIYVNCMGGFYEDRWTAPEFFMEVVNSTGYDSELNLTFFLPKSSSEGHHGKSLRFSKGKDEDELLLGRQCLSSIILNIKDDGLIHFSTDAEQRNPDDRRDLGCVLHKISEDESADVDVFFACDYFR